MYHWERFTISLSHSLQEECHWSSDLLLIFVLLRLLWGTGEILTSPIASLLHNILSCWKWANVWAHAALISDVHPSGTGSVFCSAASSDIPLISLLCVMKYACSSSLVCWAVCSYSCNINGSVVALKSLRCKVFLNRPPVVQGHVGAELNEWIGSLETLSSHHPPVLLLEGAVCQCEDVSGWLSLTLIISVDELSEHAKSLPNTRWCLMKNRHTQKLSSRSRFSSSVYPPPLHTHTQLPKRVQE